MVDGKPHAIGDDVEAEGRGGHRHGNQDSQPPVAQKAADHMPGEQHHQDAEHGGGQRMEIKETVGTDKREGRRNIHHEPERDQRDELAGIGLKTRRLRAQKEQQARARREIAHESTRAAAVRPRPMRPRNRPGRAIECGSLKVPPVPRRVAHACIQM